MIPPVSDELLEDQADQFGEAGLGAVANAKSSLTFVAISGALAAGGAAWLVGGLIQGQAVPRMIGLLGVVIGAGMVWASFHFRAPVALQYGVVPVSAVVGAAMVAPDAPGGTANLVGLIAEALQSGGLLQPPISFVPGWRFILCVFFAIMAAAAVAVPVATGRHRLSVIVPLPIIFGAALIQPKGAEILSSVVAIVLVVAALAVTYGASLAERTGGAGGAFEMRRLARAGGMVGILVVLIVGLAQTNFLFPDVNKAKVLVPQKPASQPMPADRVLFKVTATTPGPWRIGVLDEYDGSGWLLPPADPSRLQPIPKSGRVPDGVKRAASEEATFLIKDMGGRALPVPGEMATIRSSSSAIQYDSRTNVALISDRIHQGYSYAVTSAPLPSGKDLDASGAPPPSYAKFAAAPPAPSTVETLLAQAPSEPFDRLQFLRQKLYASVIAAGGGSPVAFSPGRVNSMLAPNTEATPYEITAAEALLARWAGRPSRVAFGYYGGDKVSGGYEVHPRNGAAWLEVYFKDYGWVPLVGVPPRAKASLDNAQKQVNPAVQPSDELALSVFVPVRRTSLLALYEILRWWIARVSPVVIAAVIMVVGYPVLLKLARRSRRQHWGARRGPAGRALVAYAEFRDWCYDLNLGEVRCSPLEFAGMFTPDEEHDELAWLTTRLVWGDLRRDPQPADAEAAVVMISSVRSRIADRQTLLNRFLGLVSYASLRDPYLDQVPNFWWSPQPRRWIASFGAAARGLPRRRSSRWRRVAASAATLLMLTTLVSCGYEADPVSARMPASFPARLVPDPSETILGYEFAREQAAELEYRKAGAQALVAEGRVYSIRHDQFLEGSVQVAIFPRTVDATATSVREKIQSAVGGKFVPYRVGTTRLLRTTRPDQRIWLWFPPERNAMVILIFRRHFALADAIVRALVLFHHGVEPIEAGVIGASTAPCPSRADLSLTEVPSAGGASPSVSGGPVADPIPKPASDIGDLSLLPCPALALGAERSPTPSATPTSPASGGKP